jgi:CDP-paratose 2-epimerase
VSVVVVTGSGGLIGSAAARHFAALGLDVAGIDNDMRATFFGPLASTHGVSKTLERDLPGYVHHDADIRSRPALAEIWRRHGRNISLVVHTAAQPSHDWAAREPLTDFDINAAGTLNALELTRRYAPGAVFVHCSTNKVYGDRPNTIALIEHATRYDVPIGTRYAAGIDESMPVDDCLHSLFGASKLAADVMVQEYGRYFGMRTAVFRGGTLTGPAHAAAELHGFLAYLVRCVAEGRTYRIFGYKGKQVRDAIHARDVVTAFEAFWRHPRPGAVYNLGGGRRCNISVLEALQLAQEITGRDAVTEYMDVPRRGDHQWWITDMGRFRSDYPQWTQTYDIPAIMREIHERRDV